MKFRNAVFLLVVAIVAMIISIVVAAISKNGHFGMALFTLLVGSFILQGLREIPNDPPHKAVVTKFGERTDDVVDEGWHFFPFCPYWFGFVLVNVTRVPVDMAAEVRTPDRAKSKVPVSLTFRPLSKLLVNYLNNGGKEGVMKQLQGKLDERLREWAISDQEGPQTWVELLQARLEAVSVLTKHIGANGIASIPAFAQDVPTIVWMLFFSRPRPTDDTVSLKVKPWAENNWAKTRTVYDTLSPDEQSELGKAVRDRKAEVDKLRSGTGSIVIEDLGIVIERLNVAEIEVLGGVAEHAEAQAREAQEREAEKLELEAVRDRIKELMAVPFSYSKEQALEIVQTERKKVVKNINETKLSLSSETGELLKAAATILRK